MSSKPRGKRSRKEQTANDATANSLPEPRDSTRQLQIQTQPPRLLAHEDPLLPASVLERSKIKNFLYKVEPNMPKLGAPALDLISTTAALLLKSVVERAALIERNDRVGTNAAAAGRSSKRRAAGNGNGNGNDSNNSSPSANAEPDVLLITTNHLKRAVASASDPSDASCFGFLEEPYESLRDKDASVPPSRRQAYVPRTPAAKRAKRKRTVGPTTALAAGGTVSEPLPPEGVSSLSALANAAGTAPRATDADAQAGPLERAIADAAAANETRAVPNEIVEDDEDYD